MKHLNDFDAIVSKASGIPKEVCARILRLYYQAIEDAIHNGERLQIGHVCKITLNRKKLTTSVPVYTKDEIACNYMLSAKMIKSFKLSLRDFIKFDTVLESRPKINESRREHLKKARKSIKGEKGKFLRNEK
jgi:nucleoid DNA-binding protein